MTGRVDPGAAGFPFTGAISFGSVRLVLFLHGLTMKE
mgnify:CR=1 FL=1